jgi:hypothetical protein
VDNGFADEEAETTFRFENEVESRGRGGFLQDTGKMAPLASQIKDARDTPDGARPCPLQSRIWGRICPHGPCGLGNVLDGVLWQDPTHNQQQIFDLLDFTWKAGVGAIFALLGGRFGSVPTKKGPARTSRAGATAPAFSRSIVSS